MWGHKPPHVKHIKKVVGLYSPTQERNLVMRDFLKEMVVIREYYHHKQGGTAHEKCTSSARPNCR
jgi:hypothetical protein